jgi:hypothetical protein
MREGLFGDCRTTLLAWYMLPAVFAEDSANAGPQGVDVQNLRWFYVLSKFTTNETFDDMENWAIDIAQPSIDLDCGSVSFTAS